MSMLKICILFVGVLFGITSAQTKTTVTDGTLEACNVSSNALNIKGVRFELDGAIGAWGYPVATITDQSIVGQDFSILNYAKDILEKGFSPGQCISAIPNWPFNGVITNPQALVKAGGCADPDKPQDADPIVVIDIDQVIADPDYYNPDYRYLDTLGSNGGEYSARWVDTYYGQTQIQIAIGGTLPTSSWSGGLTDQLAGNADGPMYWMALSTGQELFSMDKQYLMALGLKETGVGSTTPHKMTNQERAWGAFELESFTGVSRFFTYPKFYPKYKDCIANAVESTVLMMCIGKSYDEVLTPLFGFPYSDPNKAHMMNSVVMSGLLVYQYYDMIGASPDYCGKKAFSTEAADQYVGLCAIAAHYNLGIEGGTPAAMKSIDIVSNPNACDAVPQGNSNYVGAVRSILKAFTTDQIRSQTDLSIPIVDKEITLDQVQTLFWGDGGSAEAPGDNGLMWHFDIGDAKNKELWSDVAVAFNKLAAHWGGGYISYRYDWLTLLRVAKKYLDLERPFPMGDETNRYIEKNSLLTPCDASLPQDDEWPLFTSVPESYSPDDGNTNVEIADNEGILYVKWALDGTSSWQDGSFTSIAGEKSTYNLTIPKELLPAKGGTILLRGADSCKNETYARIEVQTPKIPTLELAYMLDTDGDGNGDSLVITIEPYAGAGTPDLYPKDFIKYSYSWPEGDPQITVDKRSATFTDPSILVKNSDLRGGQALGAAASVYFEGYETSPQTTSIEDRVGPAISYAGYFIYPEASAKDTLAIIFTEPINSNVFTAGGIYFEIDEVNIVIEDVLERDGVTYFILAKGTVSEGAKVHLKVDGGVTDNSVNKNKPHVLNQAFVIKDEGPLGVISSEFLDKDGNGTLDHLNVTFTRPTAGKEANINPVLKWAKNSTKIEIISLNLGQKDLDLTVDPAVLSWKIPEDKVRPYATYYDQTNESWGQVVIMQFDVLNNKDRVDEFYPADKMGPILIDAELKRTARPDKTSDFLVLNFSEDLAISAISSAQLFQFKTGENDAEIIVNQPEIDWRKVTNQGRFPYDPNALTKPAIGDSVNISPKAEAGNIVDKAGNNAHGNNPFVIIDGKPVISTFGPLTSIYSLDKACANIPAEERLNGVQNPVFYRYDDASYDVAYGNSDKDMDAQGFGVGFVLNFNDGGIIDRTKISFEYEVAYYSNIGSVVAYKKGSFSCQDDSIDPYLAQMCELSETKVDQDGVESFVYQNHPSSRDFKVYFPWCYTDDQGEYVGSGAFIQKAFMNVIGAKRQAVTDFTRYIGVKRVANQAVAFQEIEATLIKPLVE